MKKDFTHISILLDRSGSMMSIQTDVIGGFNTFLREQKSQPGEVTVTLVRFDNEYEIAYEMTPLAGVKELSNFTFIPRGSTALNDSLARLIHETGEKLAGMHESDRPDRVLFLILTDGEENASIEYSKDAVRKLIEHQEFVYKWQFVYIGANQDSFAESADRGIQHAMNFSADAEGVSAMFSKVSMSTSNFRLQGDFAFDDIPAETQGDDV